MDASGEEAVVAVDSTAAAPAPTDTVVPEPVSLIPETHVEDAAPEPDADDFGDFDHTNSTAPINNTITSTKPEPTVTTHPTNNNETETNNEDDDFGDFDNFEVAAPVPVSDSTPLVSEVVSVPPPDFDAPCRDTAEDERLDTLLGSLGIAAEAAESATQTDTTHLDKIFNTIRRAWGVTIPTSTSTQHSSRLTTQTHRNDTLTTTPASSTSSHVECVEPAHVFGHTDWAKLWHAMSTDPFGNGSSMDPAGDKFRWRRSLIRKSFITSVHAGTRHDESLRSTAPFMLDTTDVNILSPIKTQSQLMDHHHNTVRGVGMSTMLRSTDSFTSVPPIPTLISSSSSSVSKTGLDHGGGVSVSTPLGAASIGFVHPPVGIYDQIDPREADLLEAKRLCDITEDEMRRHSIQEIRTLIKTLITHHAKMQEQANYWLDSKEQLVMDAEMHNKMIASLVQYAQQQQMQQMQSQQQSGAASGTKKKPFASVTKK